MTCRDFETGLDDLLRSQLDPLERMQLESHATGCRQCSELLELARLPVDETGGLVAGVLGRTGGSPCRDAEGRLPDYVDGVLPADTGRDLVLEHLTHCDACSGLAGELERLAADLPRLAVVSPETSLVEDVLRRTLPASVRARRWWAESWPQWVRRPRFATELAYVASLVLVVIFGTPVSPLQAMPARAAELARNVSIDRLESFPTSAGEEMATRWQATAAEGKARVSSAAQAVRGTAGTILEEVASWFVTADDKPADDSTESTEESS